MYIVEIENINYLVVHMKTNNKLNFLFISRIPGRSAGFSKRPIQQRRERCHTHGYHLHYQTQMRTTFVLPRRLHREVITAQRTHRLQLLTSFPPLSSSMAAIICLQYFPLAATLWASLAAAGRLHPLCFPHQVQSIRPWVSSQQSRLIFQQGWTSHPWSWMHRPLHSRT